MGDRAPRLEFLRRLWRAHPERDRCAGSPAGALDTSESGQGRGMRYADAGLSRLYVQHAEAVEKRGGGVVRPSGLQCRRLLSGRARESDLRNAFQGALSERRARSRQTPAPRAAVLLRLLLLAGHAAAA